MTGRKLENKILWIITGTLLLIVFCLIFILYTKELLRIPNLLYNPSFMGSLLGAFISGSVALIILFLQAKQQKKLLLEEKYERYYKYINLLSINIDWYLEKLTPKRIEEIVLSNNHIETKMLKSNTAELIKHIRSIDDDVIMHDVYIRFETIKLSLSELYAILIEELDDMKTEDDKKVVISMLKGNMLILKQSINEINDKLKEAKRILGIKE